MRLIKFIILGIGLTLTIFLFYSCLDDDDYSSTRIWSSIATVHPLEDSKSFWLSLDGGTSLLPVSTNIPSYEPKEKQRAFIVYSILSDEYREYDHAVRILDLKSILTKPIAENMGEKNDSIYGTNPVEISDIWIGGGYLNITFEFHYGGFSVHYINLLKTDSVETPFLFEFRHHAYDDDDRYKRKGIVAFDLSKIDTNGEEVELSIKVKTFEGNKNYTIRYNSSKIPDSQTQSYLMDNFIEIR